MAKIIFGERIGKSAEIALGCSAIVFDSTRQKILLTRRTDNNRWCLPGGRMEAGESIGETCLRELYEETGLEGTIGRLIGIYSSPHRITIYADGNAYQFVGVTFEVLVTGGTLGLRDETTEFGYFDQAQIDQMDVMEHHTSRIKEAFAQYIEPIIE